MKTPLPKGKHETGQSMCAAIKGVLKWGWG